MIDTDAASDDAVALMMACSAPDARVEAVTVVAANVSLELAVKNALYTLEFKHKQGQRKVHHGSKADIGCGYG